MGEKIHFPENLYADIRIEEQCSVQLMKFNGELVTDRATQESGALIRVYDGKLWYTTSTNELDRLQEELDALAELAQPNPAIYEDPAIRLLEVNREERLLHEGNKLANISRQRLLNVIDDYIGKCIDDEMPEVNAWSAGVGGSYMKKSFYSSKGSEIVYDYQMCSGGVWYTLGGNGQPMNCGKQFFGVTPEDLLGREAEILAERERYIDYLANAVDVEPV